MDEDSILVTLRRIERLLEILVKSRLSPLLDKEFTDGRMKELYKMTGSTTSKDAAKKLKCSETTVVDAWRRWESLGLVVKEGRQYQKVF